MPRLSSTQRYYRAHRTEILAKRRIAQQLKTVETETLTIDLREISKLLPMPLSTLRNTWKKLVEDGRLPAPLAGYHHPHRWDRVKTTAWLLGERPEKAKKEVAPRRAFAAASDLRNMMQGDAA